MVAHSTFRAAFNEWSLGQGYQPSFPSVPLVSSENSVDNPSTNKSSVPGAEYRAHIDGAWPPSGITKDDKYVYDDSPTEKKQSSLFTLLIYLNQDFEGGETTYFLPAAREGILNAYPVRPVMGGAAIFPHGEINATLHEGTGVRKGAKYVIRTEIEYDIEPMEELQD
jgi:hypothetical protein